MLQKRDKDRLDMVLELLNKHKFRFPKAEVVKRTGENKGNVSAYLGGKKAMSENFYNTFLKLFSLGDEAPKEQGKETGDLQSVIRTAENNSQAVLIAVKTTERLAIIMEEKEKANSSDNLKAEEIVAARLQGLQKAIVELGIGKLWKSPEEADDYIHNLTFGTVEKEKAKGS